jgi:hypothetical protein
VQFPSPTESEKESFQNFLLIGLKSSQLPDFVSEDEEMMKYLSHFYPIEAGFDSFVLTDDFAPVEFYASRALNRVTRQK